MEFGCYPESIGFIEFLVLGIFCIPFFLIFVFIPFKIVFGTLSFLYDRYTSEPQGAFEASEYVLKEFAERWNGVSYRFDSQHLCFLAPSRNLYILVTKDVRSSMTIYRELHGTRIVKTRLLSCGDVSFENFQSWILKTEEVRIHSCSSSEYCAYCKECILDMNAIRCFRCNGAHHVDCYQSNGGCSVYGCNQKLSSDVTRASRLPGKADETSALQTLL